MNRHEIGLEGRKSGTLIVGCDFGTHSTKVVIRERGKRSASIVRFDKSTYGYPSLASPSLIREKNGHLFFGSTAASIEGGRSYSSLKVALLYERQKLNPGACEPGHVLGNSGLVAAYLAWVLQSVKEAVSSKDYGRVLVNVPAPMSHIEDKALKSMYLKLVQIAWELSFGRHPQRIDQGITTDTVAAMLRPFADLEIESAATRHFEVLPETIAPVVSLSLDPYMKPGMYAIIDVGAGTTEVAVFHAGDPGADQRILCYRDETMLLGGNDLKLASQIAGADGASMVDEIVQRLVRLYCRIWHQGYQVDAGNHFARRRWKELTLVMSGGGTRHSKLKDRLHAVNPMTAWPQNDTRYRTRRHSPAVRSTTARLDSGELPFFAVANGLAVERRLWPIIFEPTAIEQLGPTHAVEEKPESYWYLNLK